MVRWSTSPRQCLHDSEYHDVLQYCQRLECLQLVEQVLAEEVAVHHTGVEAQIQA